MNIRECCNMALRIFETFGKADREEAIWFTATRGTEPIYLLIRDDTSYDFYFGDGNERRMIRGNPPLAFLMSTEWRLDSNIVQKKFTFKEITSFYIRNNKVSFIFSGVLPECQVNTGVRIKNYSYILGCIGSDLEDRAIIDNPKYVKTLLEDPSWTIDIEGLFSS